MTQTEMAIGAKAPDFAAPDETGHLWRLSELLQHSAQVLIFYRGDW